MSIRARWAGRRPASLPPTVLVPGLLTIVATASYAAISIYRHNHFGSDAFDLGIQDQTVWGYSRLQMIPNTVEMIRNLLGDHFHPILVTAAPLYWIWDDARVLLIVQAVLLALAGIPIFWWARQRLGLVAAVAFQASYLLFWGILAGVMYDFHHIAFAVPAVSFALYAVLTRNNRLFWAMLALGLLTRENVALTFAALGIYLVAVQRRWQLGVAVVGLGSAWFVLVVEVVLPAIAGAPYSHWTYQALGTGPGSALLHIIRHPTSSVVLFFDNGTKRKLWGGLLGAWLFLPVLSPLFIVAVPSLLERLWSSDSLLWSGSFHYSMLIAPILAFAAIDTLERARRLIGGRVERLIPLAIPAAVLLAGAAMTFAFAQPLDELGTYVSGSRVAEIQSCLEVIPADASVSASNTLVPHLSHRREIYVLTIKTDADYIAIDLSTYSGHFFQGEEAQIRKTITDRLASGYGVACSKGTTVVLHRGGGDQRLSPELAIFVRAQS